ncbi:membrane protein insertase YidC [Roseicitreum antarcticum]|uniref:Membrane protein insertase YidC n=1 Tax=Roseicitreum antarcticum TaxID=564137 RepID=A0A1H2X4X5_9RHOB|nr:membrane protein insertase YidC [Roseicitreum antarcticum]SDW87942.1 protein translocase subunit yidC [Roseicitreum antarcticum]
MDDQNKNMLLAFALSLLVLVTWMWFFPPPEPPVRTAETEQTDSVALPPEATSGGAVTADQVAETAAPRVTIETPSLRGTISLDGGRLDDLSLTTYRETLDEDSDIVHLFSPVGGARTPFYAIYGWRPRGALEFENVPGPNTRWEQVGDNTLTVDTPVVLEWDNGAGLVFTQTYEVDAKYMFHITQSVTNNGDARVEMDPYGIVARHGVPADLSNFFILHEGMIQMADGTLTEDDYSVMEEYRRVDREAAPAQITEAAQDGWIGFTDKYWMATLIGMPGDAVTAVSKFVPGANIYQTEIRQPVVAIEPGATVEADSMLFAGAKEWSTIRGYENNLGIESFLNAIDWGWFFFLTKPIFAVLYWINGYIGNMGWSIVALTLLIKSVLLPLAWKSYVSMAKMKELQPEMAAIKERAGDDKQKLQKEMIDLYKTKKVNPAAGCLPILMQIPIFFSLYKVIFVTIELRHAPWIGWVRDLSAPDPSSLYNLFGLLPWDAPEPTSFLALIFIGLMPIVLGTSMWLQMKLNPAPADKTQAMIFGWMPWVFMFVLGGFASGLVLYWITNNIITFSQQYLIMRLNGHKPDLFGNMTSGMRRKKGDATK